MGSQCNALRIGVICIAAFERVTSLAARFWIRWRLVVDEANHCEHFIEMSSKISNWNSRLYEYCTKLKVGWAILSELMGTHEYQEVCLTVVPTLYQWVTQYVTFWSTDTGQTSEHLPLPGP